MEIKTLIQTAIDALPNSYVPYSHFHVAAALLCKDGNRAYRKQYWKCVLHPAQSAQSGAPFLKAVGDGKREFEAIGNCGGLHGVITDYCPPCGVCRQATAGILCAREFLRSILQRAREDSPGIYLGTDSAYGIWTGKSGGELTL